MAFRFVHSLLLFSLTCHSLALQYTPDSPCASECTGSTSTTEACEDSNFANGGTGTQYRECMSCLQNSTFTQNGESDQGWFLYNLRHGLDSCVFANSNPCETSTACGALESALSYRNTSTTAYDSDEFGYCDAGGGSMTGEYYQACLNCLSASGSTNYLANSLVAMEAGCIQKPNTTSLIGLSDSVFSASVISIVDPSTTSVPTSTSPLSTTAIAGIAAGGAAVLAIIAAVIFVRCRRRRNRAGLGRKPRWDKSDKRRSSFSFKCRNILASPLSPKFFRDLDPVEEHHEPQYGSLDAQMTTQQSMTGPGKGGPPRYYIETKPKIERHPYETSLNGWRPHHDVVTPEQQTAPALAPDRWNTYAGESPERMTVAPPRKAPTPIDTNKAALARPPAAHQSPRANEFGISPSASSAASYAPADRYVPPIITGVSTTMISASPSPGPGRNTGKPKLTTTMSSQGSGYPSLHGQGSSSPLLRQQQQQQQQQQQHGWPGARAENHEPWFPPPPPSGPPPSSSSSTMKFGSRKVSGGSARRARRESGSPVESKKIQLSFPGPPQR